jgi:hypothetical protein
VSHLQILELVKNEDFTRPTFRERFISLTKILDICIMMMFLWPFVYLNVRLHGGKSLSLTEIANSMTELSRRLFEDKQKMKSEVMKNLCSRLIELNNLGIEITPLFVQEKELVEKCLSVKEKIASGGTSVEVKDFCAAAQELSAVREACITGAVEKNNKQREIIALLNSLPLLDEKDRNDFATTALIDFFYSVDAGKPRVYATAVKFANLSGKDLGRRLNRRAMSPKILEGGIWLRERCQARYRAWRDGLPDSIPVA